MPGKAHWESECQINIRTLARRELKWTTGEYRALRRCGCARKPECDSISLFWNFAWDRLVSQMYAATATTFLMKKSISLLLVTWRCKAPCCERVLESSPQLRHRPTARVLAPVVEWSRCPNSPIAPSMHGAYRLVYKTDSRWSIRKSWRIICII